MNDRCPTVHHDTVRVERALAASPARVFRAWSDPRELARWYSPGPEDWTLKILEHELRVGGRKRVSFGSDEVLYTEDCIYLDLVPERRLCFSMTILRGEQTLTASLVTVEIQPEGSGTRLTVTDQAAFLDGTDGAADRRGGWGATLDKLEALVG